MVLKRVDASDADGIPASRLTDSTKFLPINIEPLTRPDGQNLNHKDSLTVRKMPRLVFLETQPCYRTPVIRAQQRM